MTRIDGAHKKLIVGHTVAEAMMYMQDQGWERRECWLIGANTWDGNSKGRYLFPDQIIWLHDKSTYPEPFVMAIEMCIINDPNQKAGRRVK